MPAIQRGYVELPYTLPQDSTLFLFLEQTDIAIWKKKTDWIAQKGGLVLLNTHPDYMRFANDESCDSGYPASLYENFLKFLQQQHSDRFWHTSPSRIANRLFPRAAAERAGSGIKSYPDLSGKKVAVLLYSRYPSDPRPRRELEAMVEAGAEVELICLQEDADQPRWELKKGLTVDRLPIRHERSGKFRYFCQYSHFILRSFLMLAWRSLFKRYDLVHVHNMPDVLVFSSLAARLRGARIILDLHDPMPELYQTIFRLDPDCGMVRWLKRFEKWSIGFADLVLTPNESFRQLFASRSCPQQKVQIVMNTPDERIFSPGAHGGEKAGNGRGFRIMYHGLIAERHGLEPAVKAVHSLHAKIPGIRLEIYGGKNDYLHKVETLIRDLSLNGHVKYCGKKRLEDIPAAIMSSDLGIIPNVRTPFTEINFPTRIFEYLAMGKPLIVPRTRGIMDYFDDSQLFFFEPDNVDSLAEAIHWVYLHPDAAHEKVQNGRKVYQQHLWQTERQHLLSLAANLLR